MVGKNSFDFVTETTYGTAPASGWKSIRVADDSHSVNVLDVQPGGIVFGQQGPLMDGGRSVERDAQGTVKTYLMSNGLGQWFRAAFGSAVLSTPVGATLARKMVFTTTNAASAFSLATQLGRELKGGSIIDDTHVGGQIGEFRLMQAAPPDAGTTGENEETLTKVEFDLMYQRRDPDFAANGTHTYVSPDIYYSVGDAALSIGEAGDDPEDFDSACLNKFEFKMPTGITSDNCIAANYQQEKMDRGELPAPTLDLGWNPSSDVYYQAYLAGTKMAFRAHWEPPGTAYEIEAGTNPSVTLDIPVFKFTGSTPQFAENARTSQDLPARVGWNGTDPMVTVTVITSDTAF